MVTPPSSENILTGPEASDFPGKRRATEEQEFSASPILKKGRTDSLSMKRTPQPNLTQTKLTSMLSSSSSPSTAPGSGGTGADNGVAIPAALSCSSLGGPGEVLSADFFRKLIGDNTATITAKLDKVTGDLASLSRTVEASKAELATVHTEVQQHSLELADQRTQIGSLADRIAKLENGGSHVIKAKTLSPEYLLARR